MNLVFLIHPFSDQDRLSLNSGLQILILDKVGFGYVPCLGLKPGNFYHCPFTSEDFGLLFLDPSVSVLDSSWFIVARSDLGSAVAEFDGFGF